MESKDKKINLNQLKFLGLILLVILFVVSAILNVWFLLIPHYLVLSYYLITLLKEVWKELGDSEN